MIIPIGVFTVSPRRHIIVRHRVNHVSREHQTRPPSYQLHSATDHLDPHYH